MKIFAYLLFAILSVFHGTALAEKVYESDLIQPPALAAPKAGFAAGSYANFSPESQDLTQGTIPVPLAITFPEERGPLLVDIIPTYRYSQGLSEWGQGWLQNLSITRYKELGSISYTDDEFMSPWGELKKGTDGFFYPKGLNAKVRLERSSDSANFLAYLPDGTKLTFGGEASITNTSGTYGWYLREARNQEGYVTQLSYERNPSGRLFLKNVLYGGRIESQYRLTFDYRILSERLLFDYKSGVELNLERIVSGIKVEVKTNEGFQIRWRYSLLHEQVDEGIRYYLKSIRKQLSDNTYEPAVTYDYAKLEDATRQNRITDQNHLEEVTRGLPGAQFYSQTLAYYDADEDGNLDIERADDLQTFLFRDGKYVKSNKVDIAAMQPECKSMYTPHPNPELAIARNLVRFLGPGKPYFHVNIDEIFSDTDMAFDTNVHICDLQGKLLYTQNFKGPWAQLQPSEKNKLADINGDGKPDFVWLNYTHFIFRLNESTDTEFKIGPPIEIEIKEQWDQVVPSYAIHDMNADGLPDVVGRGWYGYQVYYNLGNNKFQTQSVFVPFVDRYGNITEIQSQEQIFVDLNRDGLMDVVSVDAQHGQVHTWLNRVGEMKQIIIPTTYDIPEIASSPRALDLIGSGDDQIIYVAGLGKWQTLAFNRPETGLLTRVNNGKGVELSFSYQRSTPIPLAQTRLPVLKDLVVKKGLSDSRTSSFAYSFPKTDRNARFLGFGRVEAASSGSHRNSVYSIDEQMGSSLVFQDVSDDKIPGLKRITENSYQGLNFQGLSARVFKNSVEYWQNGSQRTTALSKTNTDFDANLCVKNSSASDGVTTLASEQSFSIMPNWSKHIHCKVAGETLVGSHSDPALNFRYTTAIDRTEAGQERSVWRVINGQRSLIEEASFDSQFRLTSATTPGRGTTTVTYDPKTDTPDSIVNPDGTVVRIAEFDSLSHMIKRLDTIRGSARYSQRFNFDASDRLKNTSDSLFSPTFADFSSEYSYSDAALDRAGFLKSVTASDDGLGVISRNESMEIFDGAARSLGKIWKRADGWHSNRWTRILDAEDRTLSFAVDTAARDYPEFLVPNQPGSITLSSETNSVFGTIESSRLWQNNVREGRRTSWRIDNGRLFKESFLNSKAVGRAISDAFGRTVQYIDPLSNSFSYTYDALGRVVATRLPSGTEHILRFNAYGELGRIDHSDVGSVTYDYHPSSRLLKTRSYADRVGVIDRIESNEYDSVGRIKSRSYTKGSNTQSFAYVYNQNIVGDQFGLLESITGPNYKKEFRYRVDGKIISSRMTFFDGQVFDKTVTYTKTNSNRSESISYSSPSKPAQLSTRTFSYDEFGRTKLIEFKNGAVSLEYDDRNRVSSASWNNQILRFNYDSDSQLLRGYAANELRPDRWEFAWDFNAEGQIEAERYFQPSFGSASSNYTYDERQFLKTAERGQPLNYAFDRDGLSTQIASKSISRPTGKILVAGVEYGLDSSRRVKSKGDAEFEYGPNGRMFKLVRSGKTSSSYNYDETSQLVSREQAAGSTLYYFEGSVAKDSHLSEPIKINGIPLGVVKDGVFEFQPFDVRGTALPKAGSDWAEPFGQRKAQEVETSLDFASQYRDWDSGLVIMGSRFYDPELGQFTTPDPMFFENLSVCAASPIECNLFGYARNNPMAYSDPTGNFAWLVPLARALPKLLMSDTAEAPTRDDAPTTAQYPGLNQQQARIVDEALDFAARAIDQAMGTPGVVYTTVKMAKTASKDSSKGDKSNTLKENKARGAAWEKETLERQKQSKVLVEEQVTILTESGTKTRLDMLTLDSSGNIECIECKGSATAPLTKNQKIAFPELEQSGGIVVGAGKPGFPGGTKIPPTKVEIVRPEPN